MGTSLEALRATDKLCEQTDAVGPKCSYKADVTYSELKLRQTTLFPIKSQSDGISLAWLMGLMVMLQSDWEHRDGLQGFRSSSSPLFLRI